MAILLTLLNSWKSKILLKCTQQIMFLEEFCFHDENIKSLLYSKKTNHKQIDGEWNCAYSVSKFDDSNIENAHK